MKVLIYSDLHSNHYALTECVRNHPEIELIISAGDNVGLFPNINESLSLMETKNVVSVLGDHERYLLSRKVMKHSFTGNESIVKQRKSISPHHFKMLKDMKEEEFLFIDGLKILVKHHLNEYQKKKYLFDWEVLEMKYSEYDVIISGHTHCPSFYKGKQVIFINPGSLGFPIGRFARPTYAIFDTKTLDIRYKTVSFDQHSLIRDIENLSYNSMLVEYLKRGYQWK